MESGPAYFIGLFPEKDIKDEPDQNWFEIHQSVLEWRNCKNPSRESFHKQKSDSCIEACKNPPARRANTEVWGLQNQLPYALYSQTKLLEVGRVVLQDRD